MKMNKLILLATFLAVAVSVIHAMPNMESNDENNDDEIQALLQEIEIARSAGSMAKTQWRKRVRVRRIIRNVGNVVKKVCKVVPAIPCPIIEIKANIKTENQIADSEAICTAAKTVCTFVNIIG